MNILGISAYYHDAAASLIIKGEIFAAAQEERFTRVKNDSSFPINAIKYCLHEANISISDIDYIVFYDKPFLKFERLLETYFAFAPFGFKSFLESFPIWIKDKIFQKKQIIEILKKEFKADGDLKKKLLFSEHHLSHAASAFFPSPFRNAAILTMDGVGESVTTSISIGVENKITFLKEIHFPHSIGLLYSTFTSFLGFKVNSGEYKVMGLAPYGKPKYADLIKQKLVQIFDDGSIHLNMDYFGFCSQLSMTNSKFESLFQLSPRKASEQLIQKHMDIAASIQFVTEEIVLKLALHIKNITGQKNLCLAGGVALNCVINGKLLKSKIFENIWVQPAAGDSGGAVGAALVAYYQMLDSHRIVNNKDKMKSTYLGPEYSQDHIEKVLNKLGAKFETLNEEDLLKKVALLISKGMVVGWHQGRMEFGPRALGNRSILADPRLLEMQKKLNLKIKFRESFRPFAPSILKEDCKYWFDLDHESQYMLFCCEVKDDKRLMVEKNIQGFKKLQQKKSLIPAVTHVDYSARVQTVNYKNNSKYYRLIESFKKITGCPVLVNTSFNIRGEPIVCSPEDSYRCFMSTDIDYLVINNSIMDKILQKKIKKENQNMPMELD
jgi:carbamoyltransferase